MATLNLYSKKDEIKVISHSEYGRNNPNISYSDVILRVSPNIYQNLKEMKQIFIDYECVSWRNKIMVKQCQNCFTFNPDHKKQDCKLARGCYCGNIGDNNCENNIKCVNCSKHPKYVNLTNDNKPNSSTCPLYKGQERHIIDKKC